MCTCSSISFCEFAIHNQLLAVSLCSFASSQKDVEIFNLICFVFVQEFEILYSTILTLCCCHHPPFSCFLVVSFDTLTFVVKDTQIHLCICMTEMCRLFVIFFRSFVRLLNTFTIGRTKIEHRKSISLLCCLFVQSLCHLVRLRSSHFVC